MDIFRIRHFPFLPEEYGLVSEIGFSTQFNISPSNFIIGELAEVKVPIKEEIDIKVGIGIHLKHH
jgi:hypothetical protein